MTPVGTKPDDPNGGQWFVLNASPGTTASAEARIANPGDLAQTVKLYLADLDFSADGTPSVSSRSSDIGTWGGTGLGDLTIAPKSAAFVPFTLVVPTNADPGDHVGVLVAESAPQSSGPNTLLTIVKRVATRIYVTIPGDARADFAIQKVSPSRDSGFFARNITTTVVVHNTGRIRLHPTVKVNGRTANGPATLLSRSVEKYSVTQKVPIWGGPVSSKVEVTTTVDRVGKEEAGPAKTASASTFVIPYVLFLAVALLIGLFFLVRWLWRKRGGKYAAIQSDLRRFERLLQQQRADGAEAADVAEEAELAIKAAIKQAGRSGDSETEVKLREKLTELREQEAASPPPTAPSPAPIIAPPVADDGGDVPPASPPPVPVPEVVADAAPTRTAAAVLRELAEVAPGAKRFALIREARAFGLEVIEAHPDELAAMSDDLRSRLLNAPHANGHDNSGEHHHEPQGSEIA